MNGYWDIAGHKGERTQYRLELLKIVTNDVLRRQPHLKKQKGKLHSAVFAKLKYDGHFSERLVLKHKTRKTLGYSARVKKIWNEKEFFYKDHYHWAKKDIDKFANKTPLWVWILLGIVGFFLIKKILK